MAAPSKPRGVSKSYQGRTVLASLDLDMGEAELICLLGPSGCGKTTLLRIIAGFITPDTGTVHVGGRDVTALPPAARKMGMVFQAYSLFPNMTALDNVRFGPRVGGQAKTEQQVKRARRGCSTSSVSRSIATNIRTRCRAGNSSAWRWRARSRSSRTCCCSTSRCRRWTQKSACNCARKSGASSARRR